jgi:hypothetical protein
MKKAKRTVRNEKEMGGEPNTLLIVLDYESGKVLSVHGRFANGVEERCEIEKKHQFDSNIHEEVGTQEHKDLIYHKKIDPKDCKQGNCIRWVGSYCVQRDKGVGCS